MEQEMLRFLESKFNEIVRFTQDTIKVPSENENETAVCRVVSKKLKEYGIKSRLVGDDKKRMNLLATVKPGKIKDSLMFNGHTDTVPAGDYSKWKYGPFSGKIANGKIYGRGSWDMKGGLAAITFGAIAAKECSAIKSGLILSYTMNEEGGDHSGVDYLLERGIKPKACVIAEPVDRRIINLGARGIYRFELVVKGKTGHTGDKSALINHAILDMAEILLALRRTRFSHKKHRMFPPPKITPGTVISGGTAVNVIPDKCTALVDVRLSYGQNLQSVRRDVNKVLDSCKRKGVKIMVREFGYLPPYCTPENEMISKVVRNCYREIYKHEPKFNVTGGGNDGNALSAAGVPTVVTGPAGGNIHSENEYVNAKGILQAAKLYALIASRFPSDKR